MPDRGRDRRRTNAGRERIVRGVVALLLAGAASSGRPAPGAAQTFLTQEEALRLAFPPPAVVERRTAFLEEEGLERARELAGGAAEVDRRVVTYYVGRADADTLGFAYFDAHRVRTLREVLMIVVSPEGRVDRIEVLKFAEPREYLPPERWLGQFHGAGLQDVAKGRIVNITGATLTARAATRAARRVLALHRVIRGEERLGGEGRDADIPDGPVGVDKVEGTKAEAAVRPGPGGRSP